MSSMSAGPSSRFRVPRCSKGAPGGGQLEPASGLLKIWFSAESMRASIRARWRSWPDSVAASCAFSSLIRRVEARDVFGRALFEAFQIRDQRGLLLLPVGLLQSFQPVVQVVDALLGLVDGALGRLARGCGPCSVACSACRWPPAAPVAVPAWWRPSSEGLHPSQLLLGLGLPLLRAGEFQGAGTPGAVRWSCGPVRPAVASAA